MKKKLLTSGLLAGLVAGAGAGLVLETSGFAGAAAPVVVSQDDGTDTTVPGTEQGTEQGGQERAAERSARLAEALQPLVDDGVLTVAQRDAVVAALEAAAPLGGRGDRGDRGGRGGHGMRGEGLEAAAEALGMTADELRTELRDGGTIAEIAAAEGVPVQSVIDAMVVAAGAHLAEHVASGDITQEQADARLEEITARITDHVNNGGPAEGMEGRGGRRHHGPDAGDSDGPDAEGADTSA